MQGVGLGLLLALLSPAAGHAEGEALQAPLTYEVRVDPDLRTLTVRLCTRGWTPRRLVLEDEAALGCLGLNPPAPGTGTLAPHAAGGLEPVGLGPQAGCVSYTIEVERLLAQRRSQRDAVRVGSDLLVRPGVFLLRPALWPTDLQALVQLHLPAGIEVAVPWPCVDRTRRIYRLDSFALRLDARIALGRFALEERRLHGSRMRFAVLDQPHAFTADGVEHWMSEAARAVSTLYGGFPPAEALVLVQPVPARRPAVVFGQATRAGGEMVQALVAAAAPDDALPGEWVLVHELLHLCTPWTGPTEAWFQEGFVTWYQEVLRARAGLLSPSEAWGNLLDGFRRGSQSRGGATLAEQSRRMAETHAYWRVYWAGAALALMVDVRYRQQSGGRRSLDDAMRLWHQRHGRLTRPYQGLELLREAERALGLLGGASEVASALQSGAFPDVGPVLEWLGVRPDGPLRARLVDAPGAAVRDAIMARVHVRAQQYEQSTNE